MHFLSVYFDSECFLSVKPTLLRFAEDWKKDLDKQLYVGALLMDLSKAFDCLPHDLIIARLTGSAYGLTPDACNFLRSIYQKESKGLSWAK